MIRILHFLFLYYKFVYFLCISYVVFICGQVSDTSFSIFLLSIHFLLFMSFWAATINDSFNYVEQMSFVAFYSMDIDRLS